MTKIELIQSLQSLSVGDFEEVLARLGYNLTVSARTAYETDRDAGSLYQLMGFNELQHQVHGRRTALRTGHEWTNSSFVDGLLEKAKFYKIEGELGWALNSA